MVSRNAWKESKYFRITSSHPLTTTEIKIIIVTLDPKCVVDVARVTFTISTYLLDCSYG